MSKQDLTLQLELQTLKKENVSLKNRLNRSKTLEDDLKVKIKEIEENSPRSNEVFKLEDIKLYSNIRDNYEYEEILNERKREIKLPLPEVARSIAYLHKQTFQ